MKKPLAVALVAALSGCVTVYPVTPLGGGKFTTAVKMKGDPSKGWQDVKRMAIEQAATYCKGQDKALEVIEATETGVRGFSPMEVEVVFRCN